MQTAFRVYLPSMLPVLLEALRISMIFNLTGVILAEMYASRDGIGHQIAIWGENFQMKQLLAGVVMVAAIAMTFNELVRWVETRCSHWRTWPPQARRAYRRDRGEECRAGLPFLFRRKWSLLRTFRWDVKPGRFVVLVGPSGCGKSTLPQIMAGLRQQTSGTITINGATIPEPDPDRVGVVFQEASLFRWLTAEENVEFPLALRGVSKSERRAKAEAMLKLGGP